MNKVYLLSKFDVSSFSWAKNFQTGNFADFEQFKIDTHFANFRQVQIDSNWLSLLSLGRSQIFYWLWARCQAAKKSRTRHRIWHKSFSMIQWAVIKNWVFLLLNKQTSIRVQLLSIYNTFCWFVQQNKICMVRIKTKSFT